MQKQLDDEQIAMARKLRGEGKSYPEIRRAIGADVAPDSIRSHCADVPVNGQIRTRTDKTRSGKDGRVIRPFTQVEDDAIVEWATASVPTENMNELSKRLGRARHSVAARIATLKKHRKLP